MHSVFRPAKVILISLLAFILAGCGSSNDDFVQTGNGNNQPTAHVVINNQILARAVPATVTQFRVTLLNSSQAVVFGPLTFAKAPQIAFDTPALGNLTLRLEYLTGNSVVGLFETPVTLVAGQTLTLNPNDLDFIDASGLLESISVTPATDTLEVGESLQLTATGQFSGGGSGNLSGDVVWSTSGNATVSPNGIVVATGVGTATITATLYGRSDSTVLTIVQGGNPGNPITTLEVSPVSGSVAVGDDLQINALADFLDGTSGNTNSLVDWTSSDDTIATVVDGLVTGVSVGGPVLITATDPDTGLSASTALSVVAANPPVPPAPPAPDYTTGFETGDFTNGNVDGQDGWQMTPANVPAYDAEVVTTDSFRPEAGFDSFGTQALRISNAVVTSRFDNWIYAAPLANSVGESTAAAGSTTLGTRFNHFDLEFDFGTTTNDWQEDLQFSVAPDRGDGNGFRMGFLRFEDQPGGLAVVFSEYVIADEGFAITQVATGLSRSTPHHVRLAITTLEGLANDVVKVYVDGELVHTGTSWEGYYPDVTLPVPTIKTVIIQARDNVPDAPAALGQGFLFDNLAMSAYNVDPVTLDPVPAP